MGLSPNLPPPLQVPSELATAQDSSPPDDAMDLNLPRDEVTPLLTTESLEGHARLQTLHKQLEVYNSSPDIFATQIQDAKDQIKAIQESFKPAPLSQAKADLHLQISKNTKWFETAAATHNQTLATINTRMQLLQQEKEKLETQFAHVQATYQAYDSHYNNMLNNLKPDNLSLTPTLTSMCQPTTLPGIQQHLTALLPALSQIQLQLETTVPGINGQALSAVLGYMSQMNQTLSSPPQCTNQQPPHQPTIQQDGSADIVDFPDGWDTRTVVSAGVYTPY